MDQVTASSLVGQIVGNRWQLVSVLGVGGMASVYEARHRNGRRQAIKILHPEFSKNPEIVQRFIREGYAANAVEHPGVVAVLDEGEHNGRVYLVMEYLEGESLGSRMDRLGGRISLGDALCITNKLLSILEVAHESGVVHRDIKPDNVFITSNFETKLLDFGIARLEASHAPNSRTKTGMAIGTPSFMAPEQMRGETDRIGAASDLWAVGATFFNAVSGEFVFDGKSDYEIMVKAATQTPRNIRTLRPSIPQPIADWLAKALNPVIEARWSSARSMRESLYQAVETSQVDLPERPSAAGYVPPPPAARGSLASWNSLSLAGLPAANAIVDNRPTKRVENAQVADQTLMTPTSSADHARPATEKTAQAEADGNQQPRKNSEQPVLNIDLPISSEPKPKISRLAVGAVVFAALAVISLGAYLGTTSGENTAASAPQTPSSSALANNDEPGKTKDDKGSSQSSAKGATEGDTPTPTSQTQSPAKSAIQATKAVPSTTSPSTNKPTVKPTNVAPAGNDDLGASRK